MASNEDNPSAKPPETKQENKAPPDTAGARWVAVFSGAGIGLLIGLLMGLSVSPTAGVVVGALASSLALILGLNDSYVSITKSLRIGAFGFLCAAGALSGTYLRTHQILSPSPEADLERYIKLGFEEDEALDIIKIKHFGMPGSQGTPTAAKSGNVSAATASTSLVQLVSTGVLYGAEIDATTCHLLKDKSETEIADQFFLVGSFWKELALMTEQEIGKDAAPPVLLAMRDGICSDDKSVGKKLENCSALASITAQSTWQQISNTFRAAGPAWEHLIHTVENDIDTKHQKSASLILKRGLCSEKDTS